MGRRRNKGRPVDGILLLDKPAGMSSNAALQIVKRQFNARKAGHTGSLDPLATGMLPICLGETTKLSGLLLDADKSYRVTARFGAATDTADADGEVIAEQPFDEVTEQQLRDVLDGMVGEQDQIPPMYSALKHQGQRLYEIARSGGEVERPPRRITIRATHFGGWDAEAGLLEFDVDCSKGTYVRTLVEDVAKAVGTLAHVCALRRLAVATFAGEAMQTVDQIQAVAERGTDVLDALLLPALSALQGWPQVAIRGDSLFYVGRGQPVMVPGAPSDGSVALVGPDGELLGIGEILDDGRVAPRRMFVRQVPDRPEAL